tara:strand:+ start:162 stop:398 length:237 start_codon:yes stop_codon:yes gene_type:complete
MSKMYASITADASKTEATKRAHKFANAHVRGWDIGVEINAYTCYCDKCGIKGKQVYEVYKTSGSNGSRLEKLCEVVEK